MKKAATRRTPAPAIVKGPQPDDMIPVRRDQLTGVANVLGQRPGNEVYSPMLWIDLAIHEHDKQFAEPEPMRNRVTEDGLTTDIATENGDA